MFTIEQRTIIEQHLGNTVVFAAPGSGKTTVLIEHLMFQIGNNHLLPEGILAMTFTKQSATDMKNRMIQRNELSSSQIESLHIGTFHAQLFSIALKTMPNIPILLSPIEQFSFMKTAITMSTRHDYVSKRMVQEYIQLYSYHRTNFPMLAIRRQLKNIFNYYIKLKNQNNRWDFDDILLYVSHSLQHSNKIYNQLKKIQYLLIDEFQDTNALQWTIITLLAQKLSIPIFVVGDDDQSIYGFRGASPKWLLGFANTFLDTKTQLLQYNFRSDQSIIQHALKLIQHNKQRAEKKLITNSQESGEVKAYFLSNENDEAKLVVYTYMKLHSQYPNWTFAVLARTRKQLYLVWKYIQNIKNPSLVFRTFHDAKGKEWDIVFIVGSIEKNPYLAKIPFRIDEIEEERRLFYVAMTRAKHRLYIYYPVKINNKKFKASNFLMESEIDIASNP